MIRPLDTFSWGLNLYAQVRPSSDSLAMDQRAIIIILFRSSYRFSKHGLKTIGSNSWPFKFQIGIPLDQTRKKCGQTCLNYVRWFITMQSVKICDWNIYLLKKYILGRYVFIFFYVYFWIQKSPNFWIKKNIAVSCLFTKYELFGLIMFKLGHIAKFEVWAPK